MGIMGKDDYLGTVNIESVLSALRSVYDVELKIAKWVDDKLSAFCVLVPELSGFIWIVEKVKQFLNYIIEKLHTTLGKVYVLGDAIWEARALSMFLDREFNSTWVPINESEFLKTLPSWFKNKGEAMDVYHSLAEDQTKAAASMVTAGKQLSADVSDATLASFAFIASFAGALFCFYAEVANIELTSGPVALVKGFNAFVQSHKALITTGCTLATVAINQLRDTASLIHKLLNENILSTSRWPNGTYDFQG